MQNANSELKLLFFDQNGNSDLRSRDHLNVDSFGSNCAKHLAGHARMGAHTNANSRNLAGLVVAHYTARTKRCLD